MLNLEAIQNLNLKLGIQNTLHSRITVAFRLFPKGYVFNKFLDIFLLHTLKKVLSSAFFDIKVRANQGTWLIIFATFITAKSFTFNIQSKIQILKGL